MPAPLSIIIPTLNAARTLSGAAAALFEGLETGLIHELIVSDGGSTDATLDIAKDLGAVIVQGAAGRGGQLGRGAQVAKGKWLLFLHADTWLDQGWSDHVRTHIHEQEKAACFCLRFRATGIAARIVAGWANLRTRVFNLPYGDQGLLISRDHYGQVGGFQDIALMEDVAMARALKRYFLMLDCAATTDAAKYQTQGWFLHGTRNFWTLARYFCGASPAELGEKYHR
ncbi:MAG: rSAM/selenodomain-associated transferase 2 [Paracoccaceae bacterium]|jgi:rSAM/selenodomain-associated transferase 2